MHFPNFIHKCGISAPKTQKNESEYRTCVSVALSAKIKVPGDEKKGRTGKDKGREKRARDRKRIGERGKREKQKRSESEKHREDERQKRQGRP